MITDEEIRALRRVAVNWLEVHEDTDPRSLRYSTCVDVLYHCDVVLGFRPGARAHIERSRARIERARRESPGWPPFIDDTPIVPVPKAPAPAPPVMPRSHPLSNGHVVTSPNGAGLFLAELVWADPTIAIAGPADSRATGIAMLVDRLSEIQAELRVLATRVRKEQVAAGLAAKAAADQRKRKL